MMKPEFDLSAGFPSANFLARAAQLLSVAGQAVANSAEALSGKALGYGELQGDSAYRKELSEFLSVEYADTVHSDDLQITAGATQGLHFVTSEFLSTGDIIFLEDPTYFIAKNILKKDLAMTIVPVPSDDDGLNVDALERLIGEHCSNPPARPLTEDKPFRAMVYVIPVYHNPTGRILSETRCRRLVELAHKHDLLVFSDDVYNLLHYGDGPMPPRLLQFENELYGKEVGNVISNGTFSKTMCPAIRLGWIESSKRIITILKESNIADSGGSFNHYGSLLATHLLHKGLYQEMVKDMRVEFTERLKVINDIFAKNLPAEMTFISPQGGYFYWLQLPDHVDTDRVLQVAEDKGVRIRAGSMYSPVGNYNNCVRLCLARFARPELDRAMTLLCEAINYCM